VFRISAESSKTAHNSNVIIADACNPP